MHQNQFVFITHGFRLRSKLIFKQKLFLHKYALFIRLHSYTYEIELFATKEFPEMISQIEYFVKEFQKISKDKVKKAINDCGFENIPNVRYVYDENGMIELSGTKYSVVNKFY